MRISITVASAAAAIAGTALLSGCGGGASSSSFAPSASTRQSITQAASNARSKDRTHYRLVTLDSLGGVVSFAININDEGQASGTSLLGSNTLLHAQIWEHPPRTIDLGTLGGPNSAIFQYNHGNDGQFVGWSETSNTDPNAENFCGFGTSQICLGFSWQHGKMRSLPTLGGNNDNTNDVNKRGQMVGAAETSTQDPSCNPPHVLDFFGVIWQPNGKITTLPPYSGDTVSYAYTITQSGRDVVGNSGSCAASAAHAVLWRNASPINLGSLGGSVNQALDINNRGQVIGNSALSGNAVTHTFLWQRGAMSDLGALPGDVDSFAGGINDEGQVVGQSCDASGNCRGYLWQDGSITDLNTLIAPSKQLNVLFGANINDRGEIVGGAVNAQGIEIGIILIPDDTGDALLHGGSAPKVTLPGHRWMPKPHSWFWDLRKRAIPRSDSYQSGGPASAGLPLSSSGARSGFQRENRSEAILTAARRNAAEQVVIECQTRERRRAIFAVAEAVQHSLVTPSIDAEDGAAALFGPPGIAKNGTSDRLCDRVRCRRSALLPLTALAKECDAAIFA